MNKLAIILISLSLFATSGARAEQYPDPITPPADEKPLILASAVGVQVYECRQNTAGQLVWVFKEPRATLYVDGQQIGSHYAGPTWEHKDGSQISGKIIGKWQPPKAKDLPWLQLQATSVGKSGAFEKITTILRINTDGGVLANGCDTEGLLSEQPYKADYVFYIKE